ncbi:MAG: TatD family hydrolase [archaeon]
MTFVDVHAHLDFFSEEELVRSIAACERYAVIVVCNGVHPESNMKVLALAKRFPRVQAALGFYPTHVNEYSDEDFARECTRIRSAKPKALGETGLDYKEVTDPIQVERMKRWFITFIHLGKELNIPLIVHSRKAELDVIDLLETHHAQKVIMHCFSGKKHLVERIQKNGWQFSIPCIVEYLQQFQDIVKSTPITQLLTETDAPYLSPVKGERNEPANVRLTVQKIAELKGMTLEEVEKNIFMNYQRLFL